MVIDLCIVAAVLIGVNIWKIFVSKIIHIFDRERNAINFEKCV